MSNNFIQTTVVFGFILLSVASTESSSSNAALKLVSITKGELEAGNFSHYSLNDKGTFKLVLTSTEGDADIYVSDKHSRVDYTNYDLQSTTYGDEIIFINSDMHRPIYISVYAHPYHYKAFFTLYQYEINTKLTSGFSEFNIFNDNAYFEIMNSEFSRIDNEKNAREQTYLEHFSFHNERDQDHFKEQKKIETAKSAKKQAFQHSDNEAEGSGAGSFFASLLLHLVEFLAEVLL